MKTEEYCVRVMYKIIILLLLQFLINEINSRKGIEINTSECYGDYEDYFLDELDIDDNYIKEYKSYSEELESLKDELSSAENDGKEKKIKNRINVLNRHISSYNSLFSKLKEINEDVIDILKKRNNNKKYKKILLDLDDYLIDKIYNDYDEKNKEDMQKIIIKVY